MRPANQSTDAANVVRAVLADPVCATILERLPALGIPDWWLTAGAVFQNVWNWVEGLPPGTGIRDYAVFYFDADDLLHRDDRGAVAIMIRYVELVTAGTHAVSRTRWPHHEC